MKVYLLETKQYNQKKKYNKIQKKTKREFYQAQDML